MRPIEAMPRVHVDLAQGLQFGPYLTNWMPPDLAPRIGLDGYYAGPPSACGKERLLSAYVLSVALTPSSMTGPQRMLYSIKPIPLSSFTVLSLQAVNTFSSFRIAPVLLPISSPIIRLVLSILDSKTAFVRLILSHRIQLCLLCYLFYVALLFTFHLQPSSLFPCLLYSGSSSPI
jgi:hypothetical protein